LKFDVHLTVEDSNHNVTEMDTEVSLGAASEEEQDEINAALQWENREDLFTRGKLKSVGGAAAGAALGTLAPPLGASLAALKFARTYTVIGALEALKNSGSVQANRDVEYILWKKQQKAIKAAVEMVPDPVVSKAPMVYNVAGAFKRNRGKKRREVAERIFDNMRTDLCYAAIVFALFTNKINPGLYVQRLCSTDEKDTAVKVIMGKIASR
jgi:hypothetical protein